MSEQKTGKQTWLSVISNMFQFILGFLLGVALIAGSAVGAAYYYFVKVSSSVPEKPVYSEETAETTQVTDSQTTETNQEEAELDLEATDNSQPDPEIAETEEQLPPNAYYANVTWPQGLSLRAEPNINGARIGGVGYDAKILILEETADKKWQRVQIPWSKQEGWVKGGNTKRASY